jgi:flagellar assembly factor FliW
MTTSVTIESTRFGTLEIEPEAVIEFPNGLIGLGGRQYALVDHDGDSAFRWLHSLEDPALALPVTNPWRFFADYAVDLSDETSALITEAPENVDVWVTVRAGAELSDFYANLRAPIVVSDGQGHQVINEAPDAPVRAPLFPAVAAAA